MNKPQKLARSSDEDGWRFYPAPGPRGYLSVTTIIEHGAPMPLKLKRWLMKTSEAKAEKILTETGKKGTEAHKVFESMMKLEEVIVPETLKAHALAFNKWVVENKVRAIHTEQTLVSDRYGFAGTCDLIAEVNGKVCVVDFKTSETFKKEKYARQLGAYRMAAIEMGLMPEDAGMILVQIGRDSATLKSMTYQHYQSCENAFLTALEALKFDAFYKLKALEWAWLDKPIFVRR